MFKYLMYIILPIIVIGCIQEPVCNPLSSVIAEYEYTYDNIIYEGLCMGTAIITDSTPFSYEIEGTCSRETYQANFSLELHAIDSYYKGTGTLSMFGRETDIIALAFKQTGETRDIFLTIRLEAQMDTYEIDINGLVLIQLEE